MPNPKQQVLDAIDKMEQNPPQPPKTDVKVTSTENGGVEVNIAIAHADTQNKTYTVRSLIKELQKCKNQDAPVYIYLMEAGARLPFIGVDDLFENDRMVDLNADDELLFDKNNCSTV